MNAGCFLAGLGCLVRLVLDVPFPRCRLPGDMTILMIPIKSLTDADLSIENMNRFCNSTNGCACISNTGVVVTLHE